jgi:hypothetical protein
MSAHDEIEAIAIAIFEAARGHAHSDVPWDTRIAETQEGYRRFARAAYLAVLDAIRVMPCGREPRSWNERDCRDCEELEHCVALIWRALIDAKKAEIEKL